MRAEIQDAVHRYASGAFPMDDDHADEIPWYTAPERAIFDLSEAARDQLRRKVRRDARRCAAFTLHVNRDYERVLQLCATPPEGEGVWITPRLAALYRELHAAGVSHSFELRTPDGELAAGILGIVLGRAAMLESMRRIEPSAGNALLIRTLDHLVDRGIELADIQLPTEHTQRLGCRVIPQKDFDAKLAAALQPKPR